MARALSQALFRESQTLTIIRDPSAALLLSRTRSPHRCRFLGVRWRSELPEKAQVVEVEMEAEVSGGGGEMEVHLGMRRLEDAIHGIIVRRAAPDWLPFLPGSSYWVPPRSKSVGLVELVGKLANPLTEEEMLSLTSARGWPSLAYFAEGTLDIVGINLKLESAHPQGSVCTYRSSQSCATSGMQNHLCAMLVRDGYINCNCYFLNIMS